MTSAPPATGRAGGVLAALACAAFAGLVLFFVGRPIDSPDFWFHLALGETYANEGLWPAADPLLHTAHAEAPVQHEWLFDWLLYTAEQLVGFRGLRVLHALAVAGIIGLAFSLFRRASDSIAAASCATGVFIMLTWYRLAQFRPDLASIPATFVLYRLLLEDPGRPPSWRRVGASTLLLLVWANTHSLFAIGPLLLGAALVGLALQSAVARRSALQEEATAAIRRGGRIAAALGLGLAASLLNPRGLEQLLTYLRSARETGIWAVTDEWSHFVPWDPSLYGNAVSFAAWLAADVVLVAFAAAAGWASLRAIRRPSTGSLRAADPALLALGAASVVAMCVSIRFLWLAVLPMSFLLRSTRAWVQARAERRHPAQLVFSALSLFVCYAGARTGRFPIVLQQAIPPYLLMDCSPGASPMASVRFLQETALSGKLFNNYAEGGFIGYWLAPRLRTFIDGRTEHYEKDVLADYFALSSFGITRPDESVLTILDRRDVDVFLGQGLPLGVPRRGDARYTTALLEGAPGWIPVFRALDQCVYLRADADNAENLARVVRYFGEAGVPFDPERGFDAGLVARRQPDWAEAHRILPGGSEALRAARTAPDPYARYLALDLLATVHALVGAYEEQVELDREACALQPNAKAPRRRLAYGLMRLRRTSEAGTETRALLALDPRDPRSFAFDHVARQLAQLDSLPEPPSPNARRILLNTLPLLDAVDIRNTLGGRYAPDPPLFPRASAIEAHSPR